MPPSIPFSPALLVVLCTFVSPDFSELFASLSVSEPMVLEISIIALKPSLPDETFMPESERYSAVFWMDLARSASESLACFANLNLPIAVRSVMLGSDRTKVVKKPGIRYDDLHRFHYLLRQAVSHQLEDVVNFSQNFKQKVDVAVRNNVVTDSPTEGVTLKNVAKDQNATVARNASS
jgi:hypothetical protein